MYSFDIFLQHYGLTGALLAAVIVCTFIQQMCFYLRNTGRIAGYRSSRRKSRLDTEPPVSVIVPLFSENADYLEQTLPRLLEQQHSQPFQIVLVYVGSDTDFFADLTAYQNRFPQLTVTKIEYNPQFPISVKQALNVGIKAARHEHIVLSTADAAPATPHWISMMAKGFTKADIVLGYCGIEDGRGFARWAMRTDRMMDSSLWIAAAIRRRPYRGIRHNLGLTKSLYFGSNGFNRLDMNIGEDDLYLQRIARRDNVCVMVSPNALVRQHPWGGLGWWTEQLRHYGATRPFYPARVRRYIACEPLCRTIFFAACTAAIVLLPAEFKYAAAGVLAARFVTVMLVVRRTARRMGEQRIMGRYAIYDLLSPLYGLAVRTAMLRKDPSVWR